MFYTINLTSKELTLLENALNVAKVTLDHEIEEAQRRRLFLVDGEIKSSKFILEARETSANLDKLATKIASGGLF